MARPRIHNRPLRKTIIMDADDFRKVKRLAREKEVSVSAALALLVRAEYAKPRTA